MLLTPTSHFCPLTLRGGVAMISHFQKLSDELIVPNLDQDTAFFYDPATKKLRNRFAGYPEALESMQRFFNDYVKAETDLLQRLQEERKQESAPFFFRSTEN